MSNINILLISNFTFMLSNQIAQLNFGRAINNTIKSFINTFRSGSGILLIVLIAGISWVYWQKIK